MTTDFHIEQIPYGTTELTLRNALGNNVRRDTVVHGPRHMDCEINKPTISIDGLVIVEHGIFLDEVMDLA